MMSSKELFIFIVLSYLIISVNAKCLPGEGFFLNKCHKCFPGTYSKSGNYCRPCFAGTYSSNSGSTSCDLCPPGSYNNNQGDSRCYLCDPGSYAPYYGMTGCYSCPIGTTSNGGATDCYSIYKYYNYLNSYYYDYY